MNQEQKKQTKRKWPGYAVYCILLTCVFLYYLFPSKAVEDYLQNTLNRQYPSLSFIIKGASLSLPSGIKSRKALLSKKEDPAKILFEAEDFSVKPKILSLHKDTREFLFEYLVSGGKVTGDVRLTEKGFNGPLQTSFTLSDIQIDEGSFLSAFFRRQIEGTVSGSGTFKGKGNSLITGSGEADLSISNIRINLPRPVADLGQLEFNEARIKADLKNRKLDLSNIELKGKNLNGTVSGALYLKTDILLSSLDLEGNIEPSAVFLQEITGRDNAASILIKALKGGRLFFKVSGPIKDPRIRFL